MIGATSILKQEDCPQKMINQQLEMGQRKTEPLGHNPDSHLTGWAEQGSGNEFFDNEFFDTLSQESNQVKDYSETWARRKKHRQGWKLFKA